MVYFYRLGQVHGIPDELQVQSVDGGLRVNDNLGSKEIHLKLL